MKNSKFIQILSTFSQKEISEFKDFVQSPHCNPNKKVFGLLAILLNYYPEFDSNAIEKRRVFRKAFPKRSFDEAYLRKQISILFQLLKAFLAQKGISEFEKEYALLSQFRERKLDNLFHF